MIHKKRLRRTIRDEARKARMQRAYNAGFNAGFDKGHDDALPNGFREGRRDYELDFEATSIIIPTRDQAGLLRQCIESIRAYTPELHEIIVIDNGSQDGTAEYLRSQAGQIRYRLFPENLGFAGGVNQGLKMSRGKTVLFINNDTVVTERWLGNLLACLHHSPNRLVGPVTNYISGEQLIETDYRDLDEMHRFARGFNVSDPGKWATVSRLTGFCVLMTRESLHRIGFLDEGFQVGNCEDDDFGLRAKLLGMELVVAKDTFIHHVGSVSMKSLGEEEFRRVYRRNLDYYEQKWVETVSLQQYVSGLRGGAALRFTDFYPSHIIVKGAGQTVYWLEGGVRHPLPGGALFWTRLPQLEIKQLPLGEPIFPEQLEVKLAIFNDFDTQEGAIPEGGLVRNEVGEIYQYSEGRLRQIMNRWILFRWHLQDRSMRQISEERIRMLPRGLPILAPVEIHAANL